MFHPFHHALRTPDKPAYVMVRSGETVTYRQLDDRSNQGAHLLRALGLQRGDTVALMMDNNARYFEICFAAQRSGLFFTAMSSRLSTQEAEYIIGDCGAKVLVVSASLAAQAGELCGRNPGVRALQCRREARRTRILGSRAGRTAGLAHRRRERGARHAVFLRHHRAAEGREDGIAR